MFSGAGLDKAWSAGCDDLARAVDRLRLIGAQDALILLRPSFRRTQSASSALMLTVCGTSATPVF